jgi:hypothetical protein
MEFKYENVSSFKKYTLCECGGKLVRYNDEYGVSVTVSTSPPQYPHKCEKCGKIICLPHISPDIVFDNPDKETPEVNIAKGSELPHITKNRPKDIIYIDDKPYETEIIFEALDRYISQKGEKLFKCYRCDKKYVKNTFSYNLDDNGGLIREIIGISMISPRIKGNRIHLCDECLKELAEWLLANKDTCTVSVSEIQKEE